MIRWTPGNLLSIESDASHNSELITRTTSLRKSFSFPCFTNRALLSVVLPVGEGSRKSVFRLFFYLEVRLTRCRHEMATVQCSANPPYSFDNFKWRRLLQNSKLPRVNKERAGAGAMRCAPSITRKLGSASFFRQGHLIPELAHFSAA